MWEWFIANGPWLFIAMTVTLLIFIFAWNRLRERADQILAEKRLEVLRRTVDITAKAVIGAVLTVVGISLAAVIASIESTQEQVTGETIRIWLLGHGVRILVIIFISYLVYRLIKLALPRLIERSVQVRGKGRHAKEEQHKRIETLSSVIRGAAAVIIVIIAVLMILSEAGIDITPLLAGAGVLGIAIGFGAQSLIKDVMRGFLILTQDQYNKGDVVKIAGIAGLVEDVNLWRTVLRDLDGIVHSIPNSEVTTASNYTKEWSRVNINIPVSYGEDLDHVMEVINRVGKELQADKTFGPMITGTPRALRVDNFADSAIEIKVLGETKPLMQWDVTGELRKRIKKAFDKEGIEIPWPHMKLYFGKSPDGSLVCPSCSHANIAGSKFCSNCGGSLKG